MKPLLGRVMGKVRDWLPLLVAALLVYVPMGGWRLLYGGQGQDDPAARTYGAESHVPGFEWVVVLNPQGVPNSDGTLDFFDSCLIRYRGTVREITSRFSWYASLSRDTLVEYRAPEGSVAAGALCPDGAVFLLPSDELSRFDARYAERQSFEAGLASEVDDALRTARPGAAAPVEETIRWVEAVNPQGLQSFGYRIGFLDACGIEEGGTVQPLRQTSEGMLYAYTPEPGQGFRGIGIPCPARTVFLADGPHQHYF